MNANVKKAWEKQKKSLQDNIREEINFFKKPVSLEVIINGAIATLLAASSLYLEKLKANATEDNLSIDDYIKNSARAKLIIKSASNDHYDDLLALMRACDPNEPSDEDISNSINTDFDASVNSINLKNLKEVNDIEKLQDTIEFYLFCLYFVNYLVFMIIDAIKNYETPSLNRTKYLQRLLRTFVAYMKQWMEKIGREFKEIYEIIKSLISLDALIISVVAGSYYYLSNRKKSQKDSLDSMNKLIEDSTCNPKVSEAGDSNTNTTPLGDININDINACEIEDDEVPSLPIVEDEAPSCETIEVAEEETNPTLIPNLVTNAFIENKTPRTFASSISIGSHVTTISKIATLDSSIIYSPVEGYIHKIEKNKIYIRDIVEDEVSDLEKTTNKLVANYGKLYDIIDFVKKHNAYLVYPIMLSNPGKVISPKLLGARFQHDQLKNKNKLAIDTYNNSIQDISKYENMKPYLENNNVNEIKIKIDEKTNNLLTFIKTINDNANDTQFNTIPIPTDYELFGYYMLLLSQLNSSLSLTEIEKTLKLKITEFTEKRYVIEQKQEFNLKSLITEQLRILSNGNHIANYFDRLYDSYKKNHIISDAEKYVTNLITSNKKISKSQQDEGIKFIMYMFNFWISSSDIRKKYDVSKFKIAAELKNESTWIKTFLDEQWSQYEAIQKENIQIQTYLSELNIFNGYGVVEEDGIKYRAYHISDAVNCDKNTDDVIKPDSSEDLYTMKYWFKYLSYVTLVGAADLLSWSTGLILPSGPVKLPVIYTPIIPIKTAYGFILIGLTICGISISPFITYNNMTLSPKSIVMPNLSFKDEIQSLKDEINNIGKTLKTTMITPILKNITDELNPLKQQILDTKSAIKEHKKSKPLNAKKHPKEYADWNIQTIFNNKKYGELNVRKFQLQVKYKVLKDFQTTGKLDTTKKLDVIEKIDATTQSMNKKLDKLNSLLDKIDDIISLLPTALAPNSINFGMTLKNPKLVVEIETDTNSNVDLNFLDKLFSKHKKSKEDLMKKNFKRKPNSNLQDYYKILKSSINFIIPNDPYPTYKRIAPTNLGFLKFSKKFVETGAKSFGLPGQLPFP